MGILYPSRAQDVRVSAHAGGLGLLAMQPSSRLAQDHDELRWPMKTMTRRARQRPLTCRASASGATAS